MIIEILFMIIVYDLFSSMVYEQQYKLILVPMNKSLC